MANDLAIKIVVDNTDAKTKLAETDRAIDAIKGSAGSTGQALSTYDQQVQAVVKSKQALTKAAGSVFDQLEATRQATNAAAIANMTLFESVTNNVTMWERFAGMVGQAWLALRSISFAGIVAGINSLGAAVGLTFAALGPLNVALLAIATGIAAFKATSYILEWTGISTAIGNATAKMLGWTSTKEAGLAAQDAINLAIARGGTNIKTQADALRFNTQWVQNNNEAWKDLNDTTTRANAFENNTKAIEAWRAELGKVRSEGQLEHLIEDIKTGYFQQDKLSASYKISSGALHLLQADLKAQDEAQKVAVETTKKHIAEQAKAADATRRFQESVRVLTSDSIGAAKGLGAIGRLMPDLSEQTAGVRVNLDELDSTTNEFHRGISITGQELATVTIPAFATLGANVVPQFTQALENARASASAAGPTFTNAFKSLFSGDFSKGVSDFGSSLKNALDPSKIVSNIVSGGISSLINIGIGKLASFITSIGGPSKQELAGRDLEKQFEQSMGGWQGVQKALLATGMSADEVTFKMTRLWNAEKQGGEAVKKVIDEITAALDAQQQDEADLQAAIEKYHFSIEELGPAMRKQKLDEQAKDLMNDWRLLVGSGIELSKVNEHMADSINEYLQLALKTGMEVPASMKPIIEGLEKQGLLTEDLKDIKWAETMSQGFDRVVDALNKLLEGLDLIPKKARDAGQAIEDIPPPPGDDGRDNQRYHTGGQVLPFVPHAHRGLALDEVPIIALRGEGVLNRGAMQRIGGAQGLNALNAGARTGGGGVYNVTVYADGDLNSQAARRKIARDVNSALQGLVLERRRGSAR
jgi:hypothetical protein